MKTLLFVEYGAGVKKYALQKANDMNLRVIVVTDHFYPDLQKYKDENNLILTEVFSSNRMIIDVIYFLKKNKIKLDGVGTFREDLVVQTADLAEALNLPGVGSGAARRSSRNKLLMRETLLINGFNAQPNFDTFNITDTKTYNTVKEFTKPCVVKPLFGTASCGVKKITSDATFKKDLQDAKKSINKKERQSFIDFQGHMLIEEYLPGKLVSIDGFVLDGTVHVVGSTEFIMGKEPYFTQISSFIPARLSYKEKKISEDTVKEVVKILGFKTTGFHCELRIKDNVAYLVEIAARLPASSIYKTYEKIFGIDIVKKMISLWIEDKIKLSKPYAKFTNFHSVVYSDKNKPMILKNISGIEKIAHKDKVWDTGELAKKGQKIKIYPDVPTPLYYYSILLDNLDSMQSIIEEIESSIKCTFTTLKKK